MIVIYKNELYHHGIEGQKWGVRNGPPYPLDRSTSRAINKAAKYSRRVSKLQSTGKGGLNSKGRATYTQNKINNASATGLAWLEMAQRRVNNTAGRDISLVRMDQQVMDIYNNLSRNFITGESGEDFQMTRRLTVNAALINNAAGGIAASVLAGLPGMAIYNIANRNHFNDDLQIDR